MLLINMYPYHILFFSSIFVAVQGGIDNKLQKLYLKLFKGIQYVPPTHRTSNVGCERGAFYTSFNPECQQAVMKMVQIMTRENDTTHILKLAAALRDLPSTHPRAWYSAVATVTYIKEELRGLHKPHPVEVFPSVFIPKSITESAGGGAGTRAGETLATCMDERIGADNGDENRLWYFREDYQINAHHFLWHTAYPNYLTAKFVPVHADRRGELFYYMHHFVMARYQTERLCNGLEVATPLGVNHGYVIREGYNPHLDDSTSARTWAPRANNVLLPDHVTLKTQSGETFFLTLDNLIQGLDHLYEGIDNGYFVDINGQTIPLNNFDGIDQLICTTEASKFSVNLPYYGNVHNSGHILIGLSHDPDNANAVPQVMMDNAVSMRDPTFYNWHYFIDTIANRHKDKLPAYQLDRGEFNLKWDAINIQHFQVNSSSKQVNQLKTFWGFTELSLVRGLDMGRPQGSQPLNICVKHLMHEEFTYNLVVYGVPRGLPLSTTATVRIYMAPRFGSNGKRFTMDEQRLLFFVMDTFAVNLNPGINVIVRSSTINTLTVPWSQPIDMINQGQGIPSCGCGWPHHMLLPKGTKEGMTFDLFAIVSNEELLDTTAECQSAYLMCGVPGKRYPETKPMGWPWDRRLPGVAEYKPAWSFTPRPLKDLDELIRYLPNAVTTKVVIKHVDKVKMTRRAKGTNVKG